MPAKSKSQQRLFGMAVAAKKGKLKNPSKKVKKIAKEMSLKAIEDFASTDHSELKEHRAMSFSKFINEAFIDDKGELQDFDFNLDPELSDEWEQKQAKLGDHKRGVRVLFAHEFETFLSDAGAKNITADVRGKILMFTFQYDNRDYLIMFNPEDSYGEVVLQKIHKNNVVGLDQLYTGDLDELLGYFQQSGLDLLDQLK